MPRNPKYEERYFAFVDILGFSQLIERMEAGSIKFHVVRKLLKTIHSPVQEARYPRRGVDFKAQSISDAIAISTKVSLGGLWRMLYSLERLTLELLAEGYFARGALVRGRLYHDEAMAFGDALIKAYLLEDNVVRFPRIMVTSQVARDIDAFQNARRSWRSFRMTEQIRQAADGPLFLHVLRDFENGLKFQMKYYADEPVDRDRWKDEKKIEKWIKRRLSEAVDNPRNFEKIKWFATYWNSCLPDGIKGFRPITTAGLIPKSKRD
jgi:hypothetical protein